MKIISLFFQRKFKSVLVVGASGTFVFGGMGIWTGNEKFYEQFVSPFLNHMDPEVSHRAAIYVTKLHLLRSSQLKEPLNLVILKIINTGKFSSDSAMQAMLLILIINYFNYSRI